MPVTPDSLLNELSKTEAARLEFLTSRDAEFLEMVDDLASLWRTRLRALITDPVPCRNLLLAHTTLIASRYAIVSSAGPRLALALSQAIITKVEERVAELDREEDGHET